jgi:hypothetical protein
MAIARPKVVLSQPLSASIGSWKNPIAERGPKVIAAITQPQIMISQGTDRVEFGLCWVMRVSGTRLHSPIELPLQNELVASDASMQLMHRANGNNGPVPRVHGAAEVARLHMA